MDRSLYLEIKRTAEKVNKDFNEYVSFMGFKTSEKELPKKDIIAALKQIFVDNVIYDLTYINEDLHKAIERKAASAGVTFSTYLRNLGFTVSFMRSIRSDSLHFSLSTGYPKKEIHNIYQMNDSTFQDLLQRSKNFGIPVEEFIKDLGFSIDFDPRDDARLKEEILKNIEKDEGGDENAIKTLRLSPFALSYFVGVRMREKNLSLFKYLAYLGFKI
jgi:hypothetical protein